jgi:hypothetical protein
MDTVTGPSCSRARKASAEEFASGTAVKVAPPTVICIFIVVSSSGGITSVCGGVSGVGVSEFVTASEVEADWLSAAGAFDGNALPFSFYVVFSVAVVAALGPGDCSDAVAVASSTSPLPVSSASTGMIVSTEPTG